MSLSNSVAVEAEVGIVGYGTCRFCERPEVGCIFRSDLPGAVPALVKHTVLEASPHLCNGGEGSKPRNFVNTLF
jgi:hypothetical protein